MSKAKIITVLVVLILIVGDIFLIRKNIFSEESISVKKKRPVSKRPENFTEGVWIKKYPGGYACFKFETPDGIEIVCDPYNMNETVSADIVTESHQDADHKDTSRLMGSFTFLKEPGEYLVKGIHIIGIPGKHNKMDDGVANTIFVFEINGIKIAHFASQGAPLDDQMLRKLQGIEVLLIQCTMSEFFRELKLTDGDCIKIIERLYPRIVIPEHGTPRIGEYLAKELGMTVEYAPVEGIVVRKKDMQGTGVPRIVDMDNEVPVT